MMVHHNVVDETVRDRVCDSDRGVLPGRVWHLPRPDRLRQFARARWDRPRIARETAREVLGHFHLTLTGGPHNLPFGRRNHTVLVETPAGRKVLKLYRSGWQVASIVHEHSILLQLAQLEFPAPRLVCSPGGETLFSRGNRHYVLFDFVAGTNYASSYVLPGHRVRLLMVAGQMLARLHHALHDFEPAGRHHLGFGSYEDDPHDLDWYLHKLEQLPQQAVEVHEPEERAHAVQMALASRDIRTQLIALNDLFQRTPPQRGLIHGDYGVHNLLFQRGGGAVVHDFELARLEWCLSDLVIALSRLSLEQGRIFLAAYQSEHPMAASERRLLPLVWQAFMLQGAIRSWDNYFTLGEGRRLAKACARVEQAGWALVHQEQLFAE